MTLQQHKATYQDFLVAFGEVESLELTTLDDASQTVINRNKIEFALEQAYWEVHSYFEIACVAGKVILARRMKRLMLDISRHYLDTLRQRPDVEKAYQAAIDSIGMALSEEVCKMTVPQSVLDELGITQETTGFTDGIRFSTEQPYWTRESLRYQQNLGFR